MLRLSNVSGSIPYLFSAELCLSGRMELFHGIACSDQAELIGGWALNKDHMSW